MIQLYSNHTSHGNNESPYIEQIVQLEFVWAVLMFTFRALCSDNQMCLEIQNSQAPKGSRPPFVRGHMLPGDLFKLISWPKLTSYKS